MKIALKLSLLTDSSLLLFASVLCDKASSHTALAVDAVKFAKEAFANSLSIAADKARSAVVKKNQDRKIL